MNILSKIFGSQEVINNVVDGAVSGVDKLFFTPEEKAEANAKIGEWYILYLEATKPQNLARRLIALIVTFLWAFLILIAVVAYPFSTEFSEFVFGVVHENVNGPFLTVMGFYFLAHVVRTYQEKK